MTFEETYEFFQEFDEYVKSLNPLWQKIMIFWKKRHRHILDLDKGWDMIGTGREFCTDNWLLDFDISGILFEINQAGEHPESPGDSLYNMKKVKLHGSEKPNYFAIKELYLIDLKPLLYFKNLKALNLENVYVRNPDALFEMKELEKLNLVNSPIKNIQRISELTNLSFLATSHSYYDCTEFVLVYLENIPSLKKICLYGYFFFWFLESFPKLQNLHTLLVEQPLSYSDLLWIKEIKSLRKMDIVISENETTSHIVKDIIVPLKNLREILINNSHSERGLQRNEKIFEISTEQEQIAETILFWNNEMSMRPPSDWGREVDT